MRLLASVCFIFISPTQKLISRQKICKSVRPDGKSHDGLGMIPPRKKERNSDHFEVQDPPRPKQKNEKKRKRSNNFGVKSRRHSETFGQKLVYLNTSYRQNVVYLDTSIAKNWYTLTPLPPKNWYTLIRLSPKSGVPIVGNRYTLIPLSSKSGIPRYFYRQKAGYLNTSWVRLVFSGFKHEQLGFIQS